MMPFSGVVNREVSYKRQALGELDSTGESYRVLSAYRQVVGVLPGADGDLYRKVTFPRLTTGTLPGMDGDLTKIARKFFRSVVGVTGSLIGNLYRKAVFPRLEEGSLSSSGFLKRKSTFLRSRVGSLSFVGDLTRKATFPRFEGGVLSFTGDLIRKTIFKRLLTGAFDAAGEIADWTFKIVRDVVGVLGFTHTLLARKVTFRRLEEGNLDQSGIVSRKLSAYRGLSGVITWIGSLTRKAKFPRSLDGSLGSLAGNLVRKVKFPRILVGSLGNLSGVLTRKVTFVRKLTGSLGALSGDLTDVILHLVRAFGGALSFTHTLIARKVSFKRKQDGSQEFVGDLRRELSAKRKTGGSTGAFSGVVSWSIPLIERSIAGILGFTHSLIARKVSFKRKQEGTQSLTGVVDRELSAKRKTDGVLDFEGSDLADVRTTFKRLIQKAWAGFSGTVEWDWGVAVVLRKARTWFLEIFK